MYFLGGIQMQKNKILAILFAVLTLIASHFTAILITHDYMQSYYIIKYTGTAVAPVYAFLWLIPCGTAILLFAALTTRYYKRFKNTTKPE